MEIRYKINGIKDLYVFDLDLYELKITDSIVLFKKEDAKRTNLIKLPLIGVPLYNVLWYEIREKKAESEDKE